MQEKGVLLLLVAMATYFCPLLARPADGLGYSVKVRSSVCQRCPGHHPSRKTNVTCESFQGILAIHSNFSIDYLRNLRSLIQEQRADLARKHHNNQSHNLYTILEKPSSNRLIRKNLRKKSAMEKYLHGMLIQMALLDGYFTMMSKMDFISNDLSSLDKVFSDLTCQLTSFLEDLGLSHLDEAICRIEEQQDNGSESDRINHAFSIFEIGEKIVTESLTNISMNIHTLAANCCLKKDRKNCQRTLVCGNGRKRRARPPKPRRGKRKCRKGKTADASGNKGKCRKQRKNRGGKKGKGRKSQRRRNRKVVS